MQESTLVKPEWLQNVSTPWGLAVSVDCYNCNPEIIRDAKLIEKFVKELIVLIDMKAYGPCHIVHFGEEERVAGYSMFQLIETSCISGHFANQTNAAYLDIFSCKSFSADVAADFSKKFFGSDQVFVQNKARW